MQATAFDTLSTSKDLQKAGLEVSHAEAIAIAIKSGQETLATKADVDSLRNDIGVLDGKIEVLRRDFVSLDDRVEKRFTSLEKGFDGQRSDIDIMKGDIDIMKGDIDTMKGDIGVMKGDIEGLRRDFASMDKKIDSQRNDAKWIVGILAAMIITGFGAVFSVLVS